MFEIFKATLSPMLMIFACIVIGFILNKKKLTPSNTVNVLSKLENFVIAPALVFNTFLKYCTAESLKAEYKLIIFAAVLLAIAMGIGTAFCGFFTKDSYTKNIYKYALTFGNFGFMGNFIVPAILGEEMLYHYLLFTLPLNAAVYSWGLVSLIPKGENHMSPLKRLLNPVMISLLIGAVLGLTGISDVLPLFVSQTASNIGSCMGPIAMILTGFVIADYDFTEMLKNKMVYLATFIRLILLPIIYVAIVYFLKADKTTILLAFFAFGTPLGLNTVVFPAAYGGDTKTGASMAMISHTLCVITIPILYAIISTLL